MLSLKTFNSIHKVVELFGMMKLIYAIAFLVGWVKIRNPTFLLFSNLDFTRSPFGSNTLIQIAKLSNAPANFSGADILVI